MSVNAINKFIFVSLVGVDSSPYVLNRRLQKHTVIHDQEDPTFVDEVLTLI